MGVKIAAYTIDKDLLDKFNRITEIEYVNKSSLIASFIESYLKNYKSNGYEKIGIATYEAKRFKALEKKQRNLIRRLGDETRSE